MSLKSLQGRSVSEQDYCKSTQPISSQLDVMIGPTQGRRHGFESGGGAILRAEREKKILTPQFLASGGTKYCLDNLIPLFDL